MQEWLGGGWECYWSDSESSGTPLLRNHTKIFTGFGFLLPHKNSHGFDDASSVCPKPKSHDDCGKNRPVHSGKATVGGKH